MTVNNDDKFGGPQPNQPAGKARFGSQVSNDNPFARDFAANMLGSDSEISGGSMMEIKRVSSNGGSGGGNTSSVMSGASSSFRARMAGSRMQDRIRRSTVDRGLK